MRLRFAAPAVLALVALAGCLTYFVVAPAPVSQPATLVAPPAEESPSTVGQARATDTLTVVDRLRPSDEDEDIVKAFRRATEDRQPVEVQDAALDTDEPATAGPVPLKKGARRRAPVTPGALLVRLCSELSDTGRRGKRVLMAAVGKDWILQHVRYAIDGGSANSA
jgi:hypothetical protein